MFGPLVKRVGVPPSGSFAVAEQVRVVLVVTPVSGVTSTLVTTGLLFVTVTESVPWSVSPLESVAVTRQRMLSPGCTTDGESVSVFCGGRGEILVAVPEPPVCFAHSYERVGVPPSGSVAVAVQVSVVLVVTDVSGEILDIGHRWRTVFDGYCIRALGRAPVCVCGRDTAEDIVARLYNRGGQREGICSGRGNVCQCSGATGLLGPLVA